MYHGISVYRSNNNLILEPTRTLPLYTQTMSSDNEDDFLAIDVSTDDYATTAAADQAVPEEEKDDPRTLQTEEDFRAQKASYSAKIDAGNVRISNSVNLYTPACLPTCGLQAFMRSEQAPVNPMSTQHS